MHFAGFVYCVTEFFIVYFRMVYHILINLQFLISLTASYCTNKIADVVFEFFGH